MADGVGELVYTGPNVMMGYADAPADLARGPELTELRTGDLARQADDGLWEVCGRLDRHAKVFGLRLDLARLERSADHGVSDGASWRSATRLHAFVDRPRRRRTPCARRSSRPAGCPRRRPRRCTASTGSRPRREASPTYAALAGRPRG